MYFIKFELPTNIAFIVDKRQDFKCWFAVTGKFPQPWTLGASSTMVARAAGTGANAKKRLKHVIMKPLEQF